MNSPSRLRCLFVARTSGDVPLEFASAPKRTLITLLIDL
jgi:hypothetical protein